MKRTAYCGDFRENHVGSMAWAAGWVERRRDMGGVIFLDLRDRAGILQVVFSVSDSWLFFRWQSVPGFHLPRLSVTTLPAYSSNQRLSAFIIFALCEKSRGKNHSCCCLFLRR